MATPKHEGRTRRAIRHLLHPENRREDDTSVIGPRTLPPMPGTIPDGSKRKLPPMPGTTPDESHVSKRDKLSGLKPGETAVIDSLLGNAQGRLRLMEMGLTPGVQVKVLHAAAFGGPLQITVRGYQLSLRREEASAVVLG